MDGNRLDKEAIFQAAIQIESASERATYLDKAVKRAHDETRSGADQPVWKRRLTLQLLRREAEALLATKQKPTPQKKELIPGKKR